MNTSTCQCPFCPLVEAKVHVCDVLVVWKGNSAGVRAVSGSVPRACLNNFATISVLARNNYKVVRKGQAVDLDREGYTCRVECVKKDMYKVCFHCE